MNASRDVRTGGVLGHLLLAGVLVFAALVMHTVCHTEGVPVHSMSATPHGAGHPHDEPTSDGSVQLPTQYSHPSTVTSPSNSTDMASLCVGVISASAAASLLRPALTRHPGWSHSGGAAFADWLRPAPSPRVLSLARLPVLRV